MKTLRLSALLGLLALFLFLLNFYKNNMNNSSIKIIYPVHLLKHDQSLLDPRNTETIAEYYLLENLSCGLVRDSKYSSTGYEGCIAEKFYLEGKRTWVFHIRKLNWSTGAAVSDEEIKNWIYSIKNSKSRHIHFLNLAESIQYSEPTRVLKITFPFEVDDTILHELSLADSALFPVDYKNRGWGVTVGPYRVENWNPNELILELTANEFSPFYSKEMPQKAKIFKLLDPKDREKLFRSIEVDVNLISPPASPKILAPIISNSPQKYKGHPTSITFFVLNKTNHLAANIESRKIFRNIIAEFRSKIQNLAGDLLPIFPEDQMIPKGFKGRLTNSTLIESQSLVRSRDMKRIVIKVKTGLEDYTDLMTGLKKFFADKGIEIVFDYSYESGITNEHFASISSFLGNQLDPSGSWAFLASPPYGPLSEWFNDYKAYYENAYNSHQLSKREENLNRLHREILAACIAVPFGISQQTYLLSDRVDPSRWNPFDSRMRIYELRWK